MVGRFFPGQYGPFFEQYPSQPPLTSFWPPQLDNPHPLDPFSQSVSPPGISSHKASHAGGDDHHAEKKGKVISIPVQDANVWPEKDAKDIRRRIQMDERLEKDAKDSRRRVQMDEPTAALKIQSHFRGYLVRRYHPVKHLRTIATVKQRLADYRTEIENPITRDRIREDPKERLKIAEGLMALLLQLDAIQGASPDIRDLRKATTKQVIQLQETVDAIVEGRHVPGIGSNDTGEKDMVAKLDALAVGENHIGTSEKVPHEMEIDNTVLEERCNNGGNDNESYNSDIITDAGGHVQAHTAIPYRSSSEQDMVEPNSKASPDISNLAMRVIPQDDINKVNNSDRESHTPVDEAAQDKIEPDCGPVQEMDSIDIYQEKVPLANAGPELPLDEEQHSSIPVKEEANEERFCQHQGMVDSDTQVLDGLVVKEQIAPNRESPSAPIDNGVVDKFLISNSELDNVKHTKSKSLSKERNADGSRLSSDLLHSFEEQRCLDQPLLEQLTEENKKLRQAVEELCKKNKRHDQMIRLLNEKVQQLENQVTARRHRREDRDEKKKKRRAHSDSSLSF